MSAKTTVIFVSKKVSHFIACYVNFKQKVINNQVFANICQVSGCMAWLLPLKSNSFDNTETKWILMPMTGRRVLVTGGGSFLGDYIAAALVAEGAEVTLLARPDLEHKTVQGVRWVTADVWDLASLRGRARAHGAVIHTVGSMVANPVQGLTHHRLNFVSTRNVAAMCVTDGVPHMILMSSARAPWLSRQYIQSKREAEQYLQRVGIKGTIIRAPLVYIRGRSRPPFYVLMTLLGRIPLLSWLLFGRIAPMPVDVLARGVARLTLDPNRSRTIYYARDLRRLNTRQELAGIVTLAGGDPIRNAATRPFEMLDENTPFGWTPSSDKRRR